MTETNETPTPAPTIERALRLVNVPGGRPDLDGLAREAAQNADTHQRPLMLRMQPELYFYEAYPGQPNPHRYKPWPRVAWKAEFRTDEELIAFKGALDAFVQDYFLRHAGSVTTADTPEGETEG